MNLKTWLIIWAVLVLVPASSASASDLTVPAGTTVTKNTAGSFGQFMVAGRLTVEDGADLTFTDESHIDGVETGGIRPEIIMNGGSFFVDARTNMGTDNVDNGGNYAYLTMNGGTFTTTDTFKFPDNEGGVHRIYLNGGIMHCGDIEQKHDRDAIIYVGGGILRLDDITGGERNPQEWKSNGDLLPAEGYDEIVIEYVASGGYTEVRAIRYDPNVASNPSPADWGAVFDTEVTLSWTPGENAAKHDVYIGTDFDDVNSATDPNVLPGRGRQDSNIFDVCDLELAKTYYWRIDEVNGPSAWRGNVWRFTVVGGYINSIGMEFVRLVPGTFMMGSVGGDPDEEPVHEVTISNSFYMSVTEVTNAQYEQFDPAHSAYRAPQTYNGQTVNMSTGDDEAVIYVSWEDANNFCQWLSNLEGQPYRLPTEAEWEYACRAGTTSPYYTGGSLPPSYYKNQEDSSWPSDIDLTVKTTGQNSWGLWDMHGNVEEWCYDWYGRYESGNQTDPVGRVNGAFRVSRGGSHNTPVFYLRSANRLSSLPEDKHWLTGFRVVCGEMPDTPGLPEPAPKVWATGVSQTTYAWPSEYETPTPYFIGPEVWVREPPWADEIPMYGHNHQPGVTFCDNGDLLGAWYSCESERGRELTVLASRLRQGNSTWDYPDEFFRAQDRNMHGTALFNDRNGKLYLFNGLGTDYSWAKLALCTATSTDNGVTWQARIINPYHGKHHQVIAGPIKTREGYIIVAGDANPGSAIHISRDNGQTFVDPGANRPEPGFEDGGTGAWIAGIHCGMVQLLNGDLIAFGRGDNINDKMPRSVSSDMGENWTYSASPFQPIGGGQRCVLLRLEYSYGERLGQTVEGPILMLSFATDTMMLNGEHQMEECSGMFGAVSYNEGQTWTDKKLISNLQGSDYLDLDGGGNTGEFTMTRTQAEPKGYLSAAQSPDGIIHVCSSRLYYAFNLVWIDPYFTPQPPAQAWNPEPGNDAKDVPRDVVLTWKPGSYAQDVNAHEVYFGTDFDDVNNATDPNVLPGRGRQDSCSYDPPGDLDFGRTYYWRIDEVNDANIDSPWKGDIWRFTVAEYLVVDDMEPYTTDEPNRIYDTWHDWSKYDPVGEYPTSAELTLETADANVHGGEQSMRFEYNNSDDGGWLFYRDISEIDANTIGPLMHLEIGQDWTAFGVKALTLHFIGHPDNDANEQMYVALADSAGRTAVVPYGYYDDEDMNDIKIEEWTEWNILLEDFNDINDVNVADVNNVYIGFGNRDNPTVGGSGVVFFDDIRLYPPKCVPSRRKPAPDFSGNCIVELEDFAILGNQWLQPPGSPSADICPEPPDGFVDMLDLDCLTEGWLEQKLWPSEE